MLRDGVSIEEEIRRLRFDTSAAQRYAREGRLEEWVHKYLTSGDWAKPEFSDGLKLRRRWWIGPIEVNVKDLSPAVGPEPEMEYQVDSDRWHNRISKMAESMGEPLSLPPLIVEYRIRWIMRQNLKKNRLAKMDDAWVRTQLSILEG